MQRVKSPNTLYSYDVPFTSKRKICDRQTPDTVLRRTDQYRKTLHFCWWNVFDDIIRMGPKNYIWSWFVVNRSTARINDFFCFQWLWPLTVWLQLCWVFSPIVTLVQDHASTTFEVSVAFWFRRRHATDRRTDWVQRLMQHVLRMAHNNAFRLIIKKTVMIWTEQRTRSLH